MGRKKGTDLGHERVGIVLDALGASREQLAKLCNVKKDAPGWWRHSGRIPPKHLGELQKALEEKIKERVPNLLEKQALAVLAEDIVEQAIAEASGSAIPLSQKSAFHKEQSPNAELEAGSIWFNRKLSQLEVNDLSKLTLKELVAEIERRGWKVNLSLKDAV